MQPCLLGESAGWGGKSQIACTIGAGQHNLSCATRCASYFALGTKGRSPWRSPPIKQIGTLVGQVKSGVLRAGTCPVRTPDETWHKSASGSAQRRLTLKERSGKECGLNSSRSTVTLLIVTHRAKTRRGLGSRRRVERVTGGSAKKNLNYS